MGRPFCRERWIRHAQEANESWRQLPVFMQVILVQVQGPWPELYLHRKQLVLQLPAIRIPLGNIGNILGTVGNIRGTLGTILTSKTLKRSTNFQTTPPILPQRPCCVWSNQQRRYENQDRTLVGAKTSKQKLGTHTHHHQHHHHHNHLILNHHHHHHPHHHQTHDHPIFSVYVVVFISPLYTLLYKKIRYIQIVFIKLVYMFLRCKQH